LVDLPISAVAEVGHRRMSRLVLEERLPNQIIKSLDDCDDISLSTAGLALTLFALSRLEGS